MNAYLVLFYFLLFLTKSSFAETQQEKLEELKQKIRLEKKQIEELTTTEKYLTLSITQIRDKLKETKNKIKKIEVNLKKIEGELSLLQKERNSITMKLNVTKMEIEKRLLLWYKTYLLKNDVSLLSINETILFQNYMKSIFRYDKKLVEELEYNKKALENNLEKIKNRKNEYTKVEMELEKNRREQELLEKRQKQLLGKTKKEKALHIKNLKEAESSLKQLESLLKKAEEVPEYAGRGLEKRVLPYPIKGEIVGHFGVEEGNIKGAKFIRKGVEIRARDGAPVRCVDDGKVVYEGWIRGLGSICIVSHGKNFYTVYGRLSNVTKKKGEEVKQGEIIGKVGKEASLYDFPTLYFEIREKDKPLNPETMLR